MGFSYLGSLIWVWFVDCYMQLEITERGCGSWNGLIGMDWWGPLWVSCWPLSTKSMIQAPTATLSFNSRIRICKDQQTIGFMPLKLSFTFSNSSKKKKKDEVLCNNSLTRSRVQQKIPSFGGLDNKQPKDWNSICYRDLFFFLWPVQSESIFQSK